LEGYIQEGPDEAISPLCARANYTTIGNVYGLHVWHSVLYASLFQTVYVIFISRLPVFLTIIPDIFQGVYGERPGIAGLHYLALGIGLSGASQLNAATMDRIYQWFSKRNGGEGKPEYRLR
jgi:hypothetical protein